MVERSLEGFDLYPAKLIGDTAYGTAEMLNWLVKPLAISRAASRPPRPISPQGANAKRSRRCLPISNAS
jgi:hypothetical protein